jgi:Protein of unknown function (DUF2971)
MDGWQVLYKYRSMDPGSVDFTKSIVLGSKLYFASTASFNDPFDTLPAVSVDCTPEELEAYFHHLAADHMEGASPEEKAEHVQSMSSRSHAERLEIARQALADSSGQLAVCSLSARADSVLMWSHYAANHTGICLRFLFPTEWAHPVVYAKDRPVLNRIKTTLAPVRDMQAWGRALLTKADFWAYEEEWRALSSSPGEKPFYPK